MGQVYLLWGHFVSSGWGGKFPSCQLLNQHTSQIVPCPYFFFCANPAFCISQRITFLLLHPSLLHLNWCKEAQLFKVFLEKILILSSGSSHTTSKITNMLWQVTRHQGCTFGRFPWHQQSYLISIWSVFDQYLASIWSVFYQYLVSIWSVFGDAVTVFDQYLISFLPVLDEYLMTC